MVAGGKRNGAGRKPSEKTVQVRIPESMVALVEELILAHKGKKDDATEAYLIALLDAENVFDFDFSATLFGKDQNFRIIRKLREKIETMTAREEKIYDFLNGEK